MYGFIAANKHYEKLLGNLSLHVTDRTKVVVDCKFLLLYKSYEVTKTYNEPTGIGVRYKIATLSISLGLIEPRIT